MKNEKKITATKAKKDITTNIICMKWGTKFGPDYVNRLYRSVQKNLSIPHRFVCFTDNKTGLDKGIETFPLPPIKFSNNGPERGWRKISVFGKNLGDLKGTALFLDIDITITNKIDDFFKLPGKFLIIKDWDFKRGTKNIIGNSSVFRFEIGQYPDVLEYFEKNFDEVKKSVRNEQAYLSYKMHDKNILKYWPKDWCVSFKRHCMKRFPINYFMMPQLPDDTKILIFHGHPNPVEALNGYRARFGIRNVKPTTWLKKFF